MIWRNLFVTFSIFFIQGAALAALEYRCEAKLARVRVDSYRMAFTLFPTKEGWVLHPSGMGSDAAIIADVKATKSKTILKFERQADNGLYVFTLTFGKDFNMKPGVVKGTMKTELYDGSLGKKNGPPTTVSSRGVSADGVRFTLQ